MMHSKRVWCVTPKATPEEIVRQLKEHSWTLCTGLDLNGYLFLNDSTSEDAAQEYAFVKKSTADGESFVQVESVTVSWCSNEKLLELIQQTLSGEFDKDAMHGTVSPRIETAEEHRARYCRLCA